MLRAWPLLIVRMDLIGLSIVEQTWYIHHVFIQITLYLLSLHLSSFSVNPHTLSTVCHWWVYGYSTSTCLNTISIHSRILITANMALHMKSAYIIYHHMDAALSVGWAQSYFTNPDYIFIQHWVYTTISFLDSITLRIPQINCFIKFFPSGMDYMREDVPCHCIEAIIDHADIVQLLFKLNRVFFPCCFCKAHSLLLVILPSKLSVIAT